MLSTNDEYKEETVTFWVRDERIQIEDGRLAQALKYLSPQRRNVILLSYVLRYSDVEIARMLRLTPPAVNYRRTSGLKRLREILLILEDKERESFTRGTEGKSPIMRTELQQRVSGLCMC